MDREQLWAHIGMFILNCFECKDYRKRYSGRNVGIYRGFTVQLTNIIGNFCNYPWIVLLKGDNKVQKGIYPAVFCYSREYDNKQGQYPLRVAVVYRVSKEEPARNWREEILNKDKINTNKPKNNECRLEEVFDWKSSEDIDKEKDKFLNSLDKIIDEFEKPEQVRCSGLSIAKH